MKSLLLLANAGVPMLALVWPGFWLLFLPIVVIEGMVGKRIFGVSWREALWLSAKANFVSTLLGIPAMWLVLLAVEMLTAGVFVLVDSFGIGLANEPSWLAIVLAPLTAAWIGPDGPEQSWMVPAAAMWLCGAFFLMSVWVERRVLRWHNELSSDALRRWSWEANILTYSMIEILLGGFLVWTVMAQ